MGIHRKPSWLLSQSGKGLQLLGAIGSNGDWEGRRLPQLGHTPTCPACGRQWEDTDDRWTHVLADCSVITDQLPANLRWIQQLIIQTSLDFTIFTAADAFARLFSNACTILQHTTDDDTENEDDSNEDASSS